MEQLEECKELDMSNNNQDSQDEKAQSEEEQHEDSEHVLTNSENKIRENNASTPKCTINDISPEERVTILQKTISEMNSDFGEKRARFKKLYMQQEEELETAKKKNDKLEEEVKKLKSELDDTKSQVTISEFTKENELLLERQRGKQELTSLRKFFEDSATDSRAKYEAEIQRLRGCITKLESELEVRHSTSTGNSDVGAVFSAVTKSLARKINSTMSASSDSLPDIVESPSAQSKPKTAKYAFEDADMLSSLVVQLEEEVTALKEKVRNSDDQLAALQNAQASLVKGNDALAHLLQKNDVKEVLTQLDDKLREAQHGLEAEKSSRADLEMYAALVNAQKTILQEELDKTKLQLRELRISYEGEKKNHEDLKETWKKANDQFVQTQEAYESTIHRLKALMTTEQLEVIKSGEFNNMVVPDEQIDNSNNEMKTESKPCDDCEKHKVTIEKLRSDLHNAAKQRNEMEDDWNRISQEFQAKLGSIEGQMGTYDIVLEELNNSFQQSLHTTETQLKKLTFERDTVQKKIDAIEFENENLRGKHVASSEQLQSEYISLPNDIMELQEIYLRLKEDLISVKIGKEQVEGELKFLKDRFQMEEEEKRGIEESLNMEIVTLRERLTDYKGKKIKYLEDLKKYEKLVSDLKSKLISQESHYGKSPQPSQKFIEESNKERENLIKENQELNNKISTLRRDLTNSEDLQRDLIALSKSLQMGLESIRQAEKEVRWQHVDDINMCNNCKKGFNEDKDKRHCSHCGKIFCPDCSSMSVRQGTRDYHVCSFCHTLLSHDSAPYFSTEPPHSPD